MPTLSIIVGGGLDEFILFFFLLLTKICLWCFSLTPTPRVPKTIGDHLFVLSSSSIHSTSSPCLFSCILEKIYTDVSFIVEGDGLCV